MNKQEKEISIILSIYLRKLAFLNKKINVSINDLLDFFLFFCSKEKYTIKDLENIVLNTESEKIVDYLWTNAIINPAGLKNG